MPKHITTVHPGEILLEEFLNPLNISQYRLAREIKVSPRRINEIIHSQRAITADTAIRLAYFFGTSAQFWLNLQTKYELESKKSLAEKLKIEIKKISYATIGALTPLRA
jgi:addiction module HigA family antidote